MEEAFAVLSKQEPDEDLATLAAQLGRLHFFRGEMDIARQRIETAMEIAEALALPEVISQALNTKALVLLYQHRSYECLALFKHALQVALENDMPDAALRAYVNLGEFLFRADRYNDSFSQYEDGLVLARRVGNRVWEWALLVERTFPLFMLGRWDDAIESLAQVPENEMSRADTLGPLTSLPLILVSRQDIEGARRLLSFVPRFESSEDIQERAVHALAQGILHRAEGNRSEALAATNEAIELSRQIGQDSQMLKLGLHQKIELGFESGDLALVRQEVAKIDALRPGEVTPFLRALAARARGRLAIADGRDDQVEASMKSAAGLFREIATPYWLAMTLTDHGEWLVDHDQSQKARPLIEEAHEIFTRLDARAWLERTSALVSLALTPAAS
jgi:tetratricopeptide (TPR) repeat protein